MKMLLSTNHQVTPPFGVIITLNILLSKTEIYFTTSINFTYYVIDSKAKM